MSIYKHQFGFEIQNQQVDNNWKNEYQAADRPPMDRGPSAASGTGQSDQQCRPSELIRARTVRRPSADRPRQGSKIGQRPQTCHLCSFALFSLALHSPFSLLLSTRHRRVFGEWRAREKERMSTNDKSAATARFYCPVADGPR